MAEMSPLRRRMIEDMTVRNLSPATQRSYLSCGREVQPLFWPLAGSAGSGGRPRLPGASGVDRHFVAGAEPDGLRAAVLLWRDARPGEIPERIPYAREPRKLPVVLNADEVVRFLEAVPSLKTRAALTTAYAAGLRASEVVSLKVADIDSGRMVIRVEHGKGGKDRYVMLSAQLLGILRTYWRLARPKHWLFPGRDESKPIDVQVLHAACRSACAAAGLGQAGDGAHAAPQLRHPSAGERHRHPHHPGPARSQPTCRPRRAIRRSRTASSGEPRARSTG